MRSYSSFFLAGSALVAISTRTSIQPEPIPATVEMTLEWTETGTESPFRTHLIASADSGGSSDCTTVERDGANKWELAAHVKPVVCANGQITVDLQTIESKTTSGGISTGRYTRRTTVTCTDSKPVTIYSFEVDRQGKATRNVLTLTARKL